MINRKEPIYHCQHCKGFVYNHMDIFLHRAERCERLTTDKEYEDMVEMWKQEFEQDLDRRLLKKERLVTDGE
jgi:hypothetical protein